MLRIGIDIGGTFTDFVIHDSKTGKLITFKLLSDSVDPASTILGGLQTILSDEPLQIIHGSTVATNALLERKGARTALITTRGFKDVLQIARQNRPSLYDWFAKPPPVLVETNLRMEVDERVDYQGNILVPLDPEQLKDFVSKLAQNDVESVAVCLIFSFLNTRHENMVAEYLRRFGYFVTASYEILPEHREYERSSTTVVNSYVSPILDRYLTTLETSLPKSKLQIMQSNGGMISPKEAKHNGARCIFSGPAGGIVGSQKIVQAMLNNKTIDQPMNEIKVITFDMGGTSTDVSLIDGQPSYTTDSVVGGCPIHFPILDIHTIGAGGGSIAYVDAGGSLHIGPQSAGANPGPACYGKGELPTVTDANLVLGRLAPDFFLGGQMKIYPGRAHTAIEKLGIQLNLSPVQAALGVIEVVNTQMERALRVISIERGHDTNDFALFSFGGSGGLHAAELARRMRIQKVIISKFASTLSAFGMLASNVIKDYVKTVMMPAKINAELIRDLFAPLIKQGLSEVKEEGFVREEIEIECTLDVRYTGQSYEINVPYSDQWISNFHKTHEKIYGYSYSDREIEIVNLRVKATGKIIPVELPKIGANQKSDSPPVLENKQVELADSSLSLPVYLYNDLFPGMQVRGPALVLSTDTTILINKNDLVNIDEYQNLIIDIDSGS